MMTSAFLTWFEEQHGKREKNTAQTDEMLREQAMAGEKAQRELLRRTEWDARYQSALYAWQAASGPSDYFFIPEKTAERVDLPTLLGQKNGPSFTELLDSVLADEDFPTGAAQVTGTVTGAVAEYGDASGCVAPASSFTDPATGMIFETRHLGAIPNDKILTIGSVSLSSADGWKFRHDSPDPEGIWMPFNDPNLKVQIATVGGDLLFSYVGLVWWGHDPVEGMKDRALVLAARRANLAEVDEDGPAHQPDKCPECGQMTVVPKSSGIACSDPKCGYWFCH